MVSGKINKPTSLQSSLNRWIITTSLGFMLIAGSISGSVAFLQSQEYQDNSLKEIAKIVTHQQIKRATPHYNNEADDETIIVQPLLNNQPHQHIPSSTPDGLHTMLIDDEEWRVLAVTQANSNHRFAIAQKTEIRDNLARNSAIGVLLPIFLLVGAMLLLIHLIIRRLFQPLDKLTQLTSRQDGTLPQTLPTDNLPIEVAPFIHEINALISRISQVIERQKRFIADAAHELRTPITALSLQAENIVRAPSEEARISRQEQLNRGLHQLRTLVVQLLDLARLQSQCESNRQTLLFNDVLQKALIDLHSFADRSHIDLGVIRQEKLYVEDINGKLAQLVRNAIENAIKYTPSGGSVDISLYLDHEKAIFKVEDTGIGIPEDQLNKVFQPFYRVEENLQTGNGLGLAICHEIALQLGGQITLTNRENGGLCFTYSQAALPPFPTLP